jgi:hypothetical protein
METGRNYNSRHWDQEEEEEEEEEEEAWVAQY